MANKNEARPANAGQTSPAASSFSNTVPGPDTLVQHFHVSPEKMVAIEQILNDGFVPATAPPARRPVAKKAKPGGLVDFFTTTAKVLVLSSAVVVGPHLAHQHYSHHGPGHHGHQVVRKTAGRRSGKNEDGRLKMADGGARAESSTPHPNPLPVRGGEGEANAKAGETFNIEHLTPNAEGGAVSMETIFVRGRFKYLAGCSEVWFDGEYFDLRKRHTARLCLDYLTGQNAWDELSARHLETEIDPQVRQQCQYPRPAEIRIYDYFKDHSGQLNRLRENLVASAGKNGRYFLKTV